MEPLLKIVNISIIRGDTYFISFTLEDADQQILTPSADTEIYFTLKDSFNKEEYLLQKKLSNGGIIFDSETKKLIIELTHTDTSNLEYSIYKYDIEFKENDYVKTLVRGNFRVGDEATWEANE